MRLFDVKTVLLGRPGAGDDATGRIIVDDCCRECGADRSRACHGVVAWSRAAGLVRCSNSPSVVHLEILTAQN
jgi:hypothetical protein